MKSIEKAFEEKGKKNWGQKFQKLFFSFFA
jgi:hypothetical protein